MNISEIEKRCEAATEGEWESALIQWDISSYKHAVVCGKETICTMPGDGPQSSKDADFIAEAKQDIHALIAHVRELERQVKVEADAPFCGDQKALAATCRDDETRQLARLALCVWRDLKSQGATDVEALATVYHAGANHYQEALGHHATDEMIDAACDAVPDLYRVDAMLAIEAALLALNKEQPK